MALAFNWNGETVPAIMMTPHRVNGTVPAALLLHGFRLNKENMADTVGSELLAHGIGSLSIDLPFHGERAREAFVPPTSPFDLISLWRAAQRECRLALHFLAGQAELDPQRLSLIGFSLGAYLGLKVASDESNVRALVLASAGDLPDYVPFSAMIRKLASPAKWVRGLKSRPFLMLHGRQDTIVSPDLAERLYRAAENPKEILWFESGHILPQEAMVQAARWLLQALPEQQ